MGTTWVLSEIAGTALPPGIVRVTLVLGADGTATGNGGCNDYSATYQLDEAAGTISFGTVSSGDEACDAMKIGVESGYLQLLPLIDSVQLDGDRLVLGITMAGAEIVFTRG